jgi:hypothetical protein
VDWIGKGTNCFKSIVRMIKVQALDGFGILFFLRLSLDVDGMILMSGNMIWLIFKKESLNFQQTSKKKLLSLYA